MPGRQSTGPPSIKKPKSKKRTQKRSLNALAIAEQQHPSRTKIRPNRFGVPEPDDSGRKRPHVEEDLDDEADPRRSKRPRAGDKDRYGNEIEGGSDSDGNEWVVGAVDDDDDSDLDSDEAMGESDEERFEGFTFRGSSSTGVRKSRKQTDILDKVGEKDGEIDLDEAGDGQDVLSEESDELGDDAIDLADAMDEDLSDEHSSNSDDEIDSEQHAFSDLSDHDDMADPKKLAALEDFVSGMNQPNDLSSHAKSLHGSHESIAPSEFGITSKKKLTLADLQSSITDPDLRKSLKLLADDTKPSNKKKGIPKKLEVPLAKRQQDRLDRVAAYEKSKETLNRWIDTVKHNRRAEHISFPLKDPNASAVQGSQRMLPTVNSKPVNDLEGEIQSILQQSGLGPTNRIAEAEEEAADTFAALPTNTLSVEEVQARRAELRRARDLLFREEKRAKRIKKIKSKSYRKVHRKEREKNAQSEKEALAAAGVEDSESEQERNDRRRAEERMGQRHRESRWAKGVKDTGRAAWDEDARNGVTEMARRGEELKRRIEGRTVDGDDSGSSESETSDDQEDEVDDPVQKRRSKALGRLRELDDNGNGENGLETRLSSMPFMRKAESFRKEQNKATVEAMRRELDGEDTLSEEEAAEGMGRRSYGPTQMKTPKSKPSHLEQKSEFEEKPASDDENEIHFEEDDEDREIIVDRANAARKPKSQKQLISRQLHTNQSRPTNDDSSTIEDNPWLSTTTTHRHKKDRKKQDQRAEAIISNFPLPDSEPIPSLKEPPNPKPRSALKGSRAAAAATANTFTTTQKPITTSTTQDNISSPPAPSHHPLDSEEDSTTEDQPLLSKNQALIRRAFAGDAVLSDFATEKASAVTSDAPQTIDDTLPGWGSWVGAGISKRSLALQKKNRERFLTTTSGITPSARKDAKPGLEKVIISEKRVKKNGKYLAGTLPHPFETKAQYERSLRLPVGPEWTTKETFQGMTMPRVLVKQGVIGAMERPVV
ncbi:carbonic anhydrase [Physcia stellaris]|nr:carbonic anhydrase [Physcia stellaris]